MTVTSSNLLSGKTPIFVGANAAFLPNDKFAAMDGFPIVVQNEQVISASQPVQDGLATPAVELSAVQMPVSEPIPVVKSSLEDVPTQTDMGNIGQSLQGFDPTEELRLKVRAYEAVLRTASTTLMSLQNKLDETCQEIQATLDSGNNYVEGNQEAAMRM